MPKPGPRKTPTATLKLHGSWRGTARAKTEPQLDGVPECPEWLPANAKAVWQYVVPQLVEKGIAVKIDAQTLARYCADFARWKEAELFIEKYGMTYPIKTAEGEVKCFVQHPQVGIRNKLSLQLLKIETEYAMTAASRSNVKANIQLEEKDPLDALRELEIG